MKEKYCIVLDTDHLYIHDQKDLTEIFNKWLVDLHNFLSENKIINIEICIPRIVIEERINQIIKKTLRYYSDLNDSINFLKTIDPNLKKEIIKRDEIKKTLNDKSNLIISKYNIRILDFPNTNSEGIVSRAIEEIPPFRATEKHSDIGFKDTVVWLSLLDDAKRHKGNNYFFFTSNLKDFRQVALKNEFKQISNKNFEICDTLNELKEHLDKILELELDLEEVNNLLEKKLEKYANEIKRKILERINAPNYSNIGLIYTHEKYNDLEFIDIQFENTKLETGGKYTVDLKMKIKLFHLFFGQTITTSPFGMPKPYQDVRVTLIYDNNQDKLLEIKNIIIEGPKYPTSIKYSYY